MTFTSGVRKYVPNRDDGDVLKLGDCPSYASSQCHRSHARRSTPH